MFNDLKLLSKHTMSSILNSGSSGRSTFVFSIFLLLRISFFFFSAVRFPHEQYVTFEQLETIKPINYNFTSNEVEKMTEKKRLAAMEKDF